MFDCRLLDSGTGFGNFRQSIVKDCKIGKMSLPLIGIASSYGLPLHIMWAEFIRSASQQNAMNFFVRDTSPGKPGGRKLVIL